MLAMLLSLAVAGCGSGAGERSGDARLRVSAEFITWLSVDGKSSLLHLLVEPGRRTARDVVVSLDTSSLVGRARPAAADKRCLVQGATATCELGDVSAPVAFAPLRFELTKPQGTEEPFPVHVQAAATGRTASNHQATVRIISGPQLVGRPGGRILEVAAEGVVSLQPGLLNVGSAPAARLHLLVQGPQGVELPRRHPNCRYSSTITNEALCTFPGVIEPHRAVRTSQPFRFTMTGLAEGVLSYLGSVGPPEGDQGAFDVRGTGSVLELEPLDAKAFRGPAGGVGYGGVVEVVTDIGVDLAAVGDVRARAEGRERVIEVGVVNRGPGILEAPYRDQTTPRYAGTFTIVPPAGTEVVDIPYPGEEGWGPCTPTRARAPSYVCEIPEHLDPAGSGSTWLLTVRLRVTEAVTRDRTGSIEVRLREDIAGRDQNPANDVAVIRVR